MRERWSRAYACGEYGVPPCEGSRQEFPGPACAPSAPVGLKSARTPEPAETAVKVNEHGIRPRGAAPGMVGPA
jgi:hypothetical protein